MPQSFRSNLPVECTPKTSSPDSRGSISLLCLLLYSAKRPQLLIKEMSARFGPGRLSLSPDPLVGPTPPLVQPPVYKSGILLQQRERNSNSRKTYHDYVNEDYVLHTGSLANKVGKTGQSVIKAGLVSKRSAVFEEKVKGTLPGPTAPAKQTPIGNVQFL